MPTVFGLLLLFSLGVLIAGLIRPQLIKLRQPMTRKQIGLRFGLLALLCVVGGAMTAPATPDPKVASLASATPTLTDAQKQAMAAKNAADTAAKAKAKQDALDAAAAAKAKVRTDTIAAVAPVYCSNHRKIQMSKDATLMQDGWPVFSSVDDIVAGRGEHGFTAAQCNVIISKFIDLGTPRDELDGIATSKIWVGMSYIELVYSVGFPDHINSTTTAAGTSQQWVYGTSLYAYVEGGKVISYQQS